ncbi:tubulin-tyrosine ligase family protein (macronuclear) [Tetrahymena thermophila SB210]|uniref:Tubulin-tyrosine ligase family protein n=1 Tax=Tetrahymena thermophila (strain SB210) TaxID=312017 RepID=Q22TJ2_TETTS|nr:tubulin-tyrosine ligase family protein [Tetrahymena thermophila SB210]EAR88446.3 tubulin-tyrosine ligase family protein [Tetrahymena thermophila SB210]|eukprot:XP_001008691.3 tubulin-tyrosine ligase family protein [Tetrahymena thermophila SB210]
MQQNNANNIVEYIRSKKIQKEEKNFKFLIFNGNGSHFIRSDLLKRQNWDEVINLRHLILIIFIINIIIQIKSTQDEKRSIKNSDFIWSSQNFHYKIFSIIEDLELEQQQRLLVNHFENTKFMCTKNGLIKSLRNYYQHNLQSSQVGYSVFHTTPTTFIVKQGFEDIEFQKFLAKYKAFENGKFETELIPMKHCIQNLWLIKPGNQNQGRGIVIYKNQNDIINFFQNKLNQQQWIIQKYIEKPLLYKNRKFDIRMWALITCKNEIFFYHDGYMRTSSHDYNLDNCSSNIHLTNNFQQKYFQNYGLYEPGNTLPIDRLFEYISFNNKDKASQIKSLLISRMKDLVIDSFLAARKNMVQQKKYLNYELFGYDFLIDEDLRVWLLEINSNPYLGTPNDEMKNLIPKMIEEMLDIMLKNKPRKNNKFELIYSESMQGGWSQFLVSVNQRQSFNTSLYPEQQLQQLQFIRNENTPTLCKTIRQEFYGATQTNFITNLMGKKDDEQIAKQLYQHLYLQIQNYPFKDYDPFRNSFTTILTKIKIWKELEQKELKWYIKGFKLILESNIKLILLEKEYSDKVYSIILQEDLPEQIQSILIEASYEISNQILNKNISIKENMNPEELQHDKQIEILTKSLLVIGGQFDRKKYIPGETQNSEKSRKQLIQNGGLIVIYFLQQNEDLSFENINSSIKQFLDSLDYQDFFYQNQLFKEWIEQVNSIKPKKYQFFNGFSQNLNNEEIKDHNFINNNSEFNKKNHKTNKTRIANILIHANYENKIENNQEQLQNRNEIDENQKIKLKNENLFVERSKSNENLSQNTQIPFPKFLDSFFNKTYNQNEFANYLEQQLQILSPKFKQQFYKIKFMSQQKIDQRDKQLSAVQIPNHKKFKFNKSASPSRQSDRKELMNKSINQISKIENQKFQQNVNLLTICKSELELQKNTQQNSINIENTKLEIIKNQVKSLEQIRSESPFVRRHQNQIQKCRHYNLDKEDQKLSFQTAQQNKQPIKYTLMNNKQLSPNSAIQKNSDFKQKSCEQNQFFLPQNFQIQQQNLKKKQKELSPSREFRKKQSVTINSVNNQQAVFSGFQKIRSSPKLNELRNRKIENQANKYNYDIEKDTKNESLQEKREFIQVEDILAQQNFQILNQQVNNLEQEQIESNTNQQNKLELNQIDTTMTQQKQEIDINKSINYSDKDFLNFDTEVDLSNQKQQQNLNDNQCEIINKNFKSINQSNVDQNIIEQHA